MVADKFTGLGKKFFKSAARMVGRTATPSDNAICLHTNIHANECVPSDVRFTSAVTNNSFMLRPSNYSEGDILAVDKAYIDYGKFEELTRRGAVYVTKMKKNLVYGTESDIMRESSPTPTQGRKRQSSSRF